MGKLPPEDCKFPEANNFGAEINCEIKNTANAFPQMVLLLTGEGKVVYADRSWQKLLNRVDLPDEFFEGAPGWGEFFRSVEITAGSSKANEDYSIISRGFKRVKSGADESYTTRVKISREKQDDWYDLEIRSFPGKGAEIIMLLEDITKIKENERQISRQKQWLEALFENSTAAIAMTDEKHRIIDINKKFEEKFKFELNEIEGMDLDKVLNKGREDSADQNLSRQVMSGKAVKTEGTRYDRHGRAMEFLIKGVPIYVQGEVLGIYAIYEDISEIKEQERKLKINKFSVDRAAVAVFRIRPDGHFIYANERAGELLGCESEELISKNISDVDPNYGEKEIERLWQQLKEEKKLDFESELETSEGEIIPVRITSRYLKYQGQEYHFAFVRDISDRKRAERELKIRERQYRELFDKSPAGMMLEDENGNILKVNEVLCEHSGYTPEELEGSSIFETLVPEEQHEEARKNIQKLLEGEDLEFITTSRTKKGEEFYVYLKETSVQLPDGRPGVLSMQIDITDLKEQQEKIEYLSYHDSLTGLYNRTFLEEEIERLDTGRQLPISMMMIDVNGLKLINDSYGHDMGDKLLKKTAEILENSSREEEIAGRWGGDEFLIVLPRTDREEAELIFQRIKSRCKDARLTDDTGEKIPVSLAIGIGVKEKEKEDIYDVLGVAEDNMFNDKLTESRSVKHNILQAMLNTLGAKSQETEAHVNRLEKLALKLGEKLDLNHTQMEKLTLLATLHDIGKTAIPQDILTKPDSLSDEEWEQIREHPTTGYRIASSSDEFTHVAEEILSHHERWDGSGYPRGLAGEDIPLLARIIAIIDAYDVMTNGRPYKEPISREEALEELKRCAGTQFDPELVEKFVDLMQGK